MRIRCELPKRYLARKATWYKQDSPVQILYCMAVFHMSAMLPIPHHGRRYIPELPCSCIPCPGTINAMSTRFGLFHTGRGPEGEHCFPYEGPSIRLTRLKDDSSDVPADRNGIWVSKSELSRASKKLRMRSVTHSFISAVVILFCLSRREQKTLASGVGPGGVYSKACAV